MINQDIYKKPEFYYALVPVLFGLWTVSLLFVYVPRSEKELEKQISQYEEARDVMTEILTLDPGRLQLGKDGTKAEFDYASVVQDAARACGISASNYKLSSGKVITSGGRKNQSAKVTLKKIDIARFAEFLSLIQFRWPALECVQLRLSRKKGLADEWSVDLDFVYYY